MTEAGILRSELTMLIDVQHHRLLSSLAAHVSDLENGCAAQAFLDLQVVIIGVGSPEILADAEDIEGCVGTSNTRRTCTYGRKDLHPGLPCEAVVKSVKRDGRWTPRIVFKPISPARWPIIQKWIHIRLSVKDPNSPAHHEITLRRWLISKPYSRRKIVLVGRVNLTNNYSLPRYKSRQGPVRAVKRTEVFIAQSKSQGQPVGEFPRILAEKVDCIDGDVSLLIAHGNGSAAGGADRILGGRASRNGTYEEVGQSLCISANRRVVRPGTSCPIEGKTSKPVAVVKFVHASLPELASESDFVFSNTIRDDIRQMTDNIIPSFWGSNSHL